MAAILARKLGMTQRFLDDGKVERVTVLSGTFHMGMGDKFDEAAAKELPTGSFVVMPTRQAHFAMTKGETVVQVHGMGAWGVTYVNPADDPRWGQWIEWGDDPPPLPCP